MQSILTDYIMFSLQALSTDSVERLPVFNKTARRNYEVTQGADDWCVPSREPLDLAVFRLAKWNEAWSLQEGNRTVVWPTDMSEWGRTWCPHGQTPTLHSLWSRVVSKQYHSCCMQWFSSAPPPWLYYIIFGGLRNAVKVTVLTADHTNSYEVEQSA